MSTVEGGGRKWQDLESTQPQGGQQLGVKVFDHTQKTSRTFTELFTLAKVTTSEGETLFVNRRSLKKFLDRNKSTADALGIKRYMWTSTIVDKLTQKSQKNFEKEFKRLYLQQDVENPREAVKKFIHECRVSNNERGQFATAIVKVLNSNDVNHAVLQALFSELDVEAGVRRGESSCINNDILGKLWCSLKPELFEELCKTEDTTKLYNILMAVCENGSSGENVRKILSKVGDVSIHKEPYLETPLTAAIKYEQEEVVKALLQEKQVDPYVRRGQWGTEDQDKGKILNVTRKSPLQMALEGGNEKIVDLILEKVKGSPKYTEQLLQIALSAEKCSMSTIKKLLGLDRVQRINSNDIERAVKRGDVEILKFMLEHDKAKELTIDIYCLEDALLRLCLCKTNEKEHEKYKQIIEMLVECKKLDRKESLDVQAIEYLGDDDWSIIALLLNEKYFDESHIKHANEEMMDIREPLNLYQKNRG